MAKDLINFNLLYEDIMQDLTSQKRTGFLGRFLTDQRFVEEDFQQVWKGSAFKRLMYALDFAIGKSSAKKSQDGMYVDVDNMLDKKSAEYEDLSAGQTGTNSVGIKLTYDIVPEQRYYLLKTLLLRNEKDNSSAGHFGLFNDYITSLVTQVENPQKKIKFFNKTKNINIDLKLQIIAVSQAGNNNDYSQNKKHSKLSESSFNCSVFIWFDAEQYKTELKNLLHNSTTSSPDKVADASTDENNSKEVLQQQEANIDKINDKSSKIKIGVINITLNQRQLGKIADLAKGLVNNNLVDPLANIAGKALGINKIFGLNKDTDEGYDLVKVNPSRLHSIFNIGDIAKPFIKVKSVVTLEQWLYENDYTKSASDINNKNTNVAVQLRKSFDEKNLKIDSLSPGKLTSDLSNGKVWAVADLVSRNIWTSKNVDNSTQITNYLTNDISQINKALTCRWQYFLDSYRTTYAQYRVSFSLTDLYSAVANFNYTISRFIQIIQDNSKSFDIFKENINLINNYPIILLNHNNTSLSSMHISQQQLNNVTTFLRKWETIKDRLINSADSSNGTSFGMGIPNKSTHKNLYTSLYELYHNNIFNIQRYKSRELNYDEINIQSFFHSWWLKRFRHYIKNLNNDDIFKVSAQKKLFTNKGKQVENQGNNKSVQSFNAFLDNDTDAATYFQTNVIDSPDLYINGTSLNDEFQDKVINPIIDTLNENKDKFTIIQDCNKIFKNLTSYSESAESENINQSAKRYYIPLKLNKK